MQELTTPLSNAVRSSAVAAPVLLGAGDPGSTRLVYAMVAGLIAIGVVFILLGIWLVRQTRYDLPVLAPLERMGDKDWRRQRDPATQRRVLDEVRPAGAEPLRPESSAPNLDAEFELADRPVAPMSDLAPPSLETRTPTPEGIERPDWFAIVDGPVVVVDGPIVVVDGPIVVVDDPADVVEGPDQR